MSSLKTRLSNNSSVVCGVLNNSVSFEDSCQQVELTENVIAPAFQDLLPYEHVPADGAGKVLGGAAITRLRRLRQSVCFRGCEASVKNHLAQKIKAVLELLVSSREVKHWSLGFSFECK